MESKGQAWDPGWRVACIYLETVGLPQEAGVQRPDPHVPLGTQVQLGECGQRFPRAESTGGSKGEQWRKQSFPPLSLPTPT